MSCFHSSEVGHKNESRRGRLYKLRESGLKLPKCGGSMSSQAKGTSLQGGLSWGYESVLDVTVILPRTIRHPLLDHLLEQFVV